MPLPSLPRRAAGYIRSATSCPTRLTEQEADIRAAIARNGDVLDESLMLRETPTGTGPLVDYPVLSDFLRQVSAGTIRCSRLYVRDLSRFGRFSNPRDCHAVCALLERHGIEIYLTSDGAPYGLRSPLERLHFSLVSP